MSRLEELITEYCPNGVRYVGLGEICNIRTGKLNANAMVENGEYPFFTCDAKPYRIDDYAFDTDAILISGNGSRVGHLHRYMGKFNAYQRTYVLDEFIETINKDYLYHFLGANLKQYILVNCKKGSVPYITLPMIKSFNVPIPPLEVQEEIVRILDEYTEKTNELVENLTAELTARKKQYENYRDSLLSFDEIIPMVKLKDIATDIYRGAGIKRDEVTSDGIPCVRYGEIYTSYDISFSKCISYTSEDVVSKPKYFEHGDIIFAITGESVEEIAKSIAYLGHEKCMAGGDTVVMKHNQEPRYISYALSTTAAQMQKSKGKVKSKVVHSSVPALKEIEIPLPDFEMQKHVADLLDNFHNLCNDISAGLSAEIEARQKQYEYYRDKLLTFKEMS